MSAEHSLQMSEIFPIGLKKKQTTKQIKNFKEIFFTVVLYTCYSYRVYFLIIIIQDVA